MHTDRAYLVCQFQAYGPIFTYLAQSENWVLLITLVNHNFPSKIAI